MLYFSKYANIKLGKDDDPPEFNGVSWWHSFKPFYGRNLRVTSGLYYKTFYP
jgi:hypothetical protein